MRGVSERATGIGLEAASFAAFGAARWFTICGGTSDVVSVAMAAVSREAVEPDERLLCDFFRNPRTLDNRHHVSIDAFTQVLEKLGNFLFRRQAGFP
jgi:hypothetical protein